MIPGQFDYVRPADLDETLKILRSREGEAKLLSGGYSLLPLMKLRLASPELLVDLRDVSGLDSILQTDDEFRIGGRVTHRQIFEDDALRAVLPIVHETAGGIGDPQVRNWGTIGGSSAHADPSSDWPAVLIALGARIVCRSTAGERVIPAREFFLDSFTTAIASTEVLTEIRLTIPGPRSGGAYAKLERRAGDFATVGAAVQLALDAPGRIEQIGIGLTAVAESPFAATVAEGVLRNARPSEEMFREAGIAAADQSRPVADGHGPVDYKLGMVREMTVRALRRAVARALAA
jgi:aerobic carbon-monoxide dehydrogenase medium subunit